MCFNDRLIDLDKVWCSLRYASEISRVVWLGWLCKISRPSTMKLHLHDWKREVRWDGFIQWILMLSEARIDTSAWPMYNMWTQKEFG